MIAWLLSVVIRFALSRQREYLADAGSVELTKNPDAMIMALRKIEGRGELHAATSAVMEMCVDNPREGFADIFATHPSVDESHGGAGEICRRPRPRPAGNCAARGRASRTRYRRRKKALGERRGSTAGAVRPLGPGSPMPPRRGLPGPWGPEPPPPTGGPWGPKQN